MSTNPNYVPTLWSWGVKHWRHKWEFMPLFLTLEVANHSLTAPLGEVVLTPPVPDHTEDSQGQAGTPSVKRSLKLPS